ncbi:hypothetical protein GCM10009665_21130 [Kitasatospora nipponensis]|uniref:Uncharacterized protein n=1 Tax=Kitasatospora nipponensis TaxID=258049 RepID=A0ABN1W322_9ACTN
MARTPLAGVAGRAFARKAYFPVELAARDMGTGDRVADLPLSRAADGFPRGGNEGLGQIVKPLPAAES